MHQTDLREESLAAQGREAGADLDREKTLAPYLERLTAGTDTSLALEPWEREVLEKFPKNKDAAGSDWPALVAQGLAFGAKCRARAEQFKDQEAGDIERPAELGDELIAEMVVGLVVCEELQAGVNSLIRSGDMGKAKRLSAFRHKVIQSVSAMKDLLGSEAYAAAGARAADVLASRPKAEKPKSTASASLEEGSQQTPTQYRKDHAPARMVYRTTVKKRKLIRPLIAVLAVCLTVWIVLTVKHPSYVAPPPLTIKELGHVVGVRSVESKHPSVYVRVEGEAWNFLSPEQRRTALEEIGRVVDQAGYLGAQVWTTDGLAIGQWLKETGVSLKQSTPGQT